MKIALSTDEWHPINLFIKEWLQKRNYECTYFGSYLSHQDEDWVETTAKAAQAVATGLCQEGIFSCWSGTGACIVANKIAGIRAALCNDAETASLARIWNHANVLTLANRVLTPEIADAILTTWFTTNNDSALAQKSIQKIGDLEIS